MLLAPEVEVDMLLAGIMVVKLRDLRKKGLVTRDERGFSFSSRCAGLALRRMLEDSGASIVSSWRGTTRYAIAMAVKSAATAARRPLGARAIGVWTLWRLLAATYRGLMSAVACKAYQLAVILVRLLL